MTPAQQFQKTIQSLLASRSVLNASLGTSRAAKQAREFAVQGLYLTAVRSFEGFLEDQIFALACNKVEWKSRTLNSGRIRWSNRLREDRLEMVKELVHRGKNYVDYLPYERTLEISNLLFTGGRPFSSLDQADRKTLARCLSVRNYIAHRSEFARKKFIKLYQEIKPTRVQHPRPIHYLDDQIRVNVTLFEHDLAQLHQISSFLS